MKINTKSSRELSCCLKALALKSSIKRTRTPAKKKIKVEFMKKKFNKLSTNKIRLLKNWKPEKNLEEKIINRFLYENY